MQNAIFETGHFAFQRRDKFVILLAIRSESRNIVYITITRYGVVVPLNCH
jgi:hypothetical protein